MRLRLVGKSEQNTGCEAVGFGCATQSTIGCNNPSENLASDASTFPKHSLRTLMGPAAAQSCGFSLYELARVETELNSRRNGPFACSEAILTPQKYGRKSCSAVLSPVMARPGNAMSRDNGFVEEKEECNFAVGSASSEDTSDDSTIEL